VYGHDLKNAKVVWPVLKQDGACDVDKICLQPVTSSADDGTLRLLRLPLPFAKNGKQVILQRADERPFAIAVQTPPVPGALDTPKADPKFQERVTVGADDATIVGVGLEAISAVLFRTKPLIIKKKTGSVINLAGLAAAGATALARTVDVVLVSLSGTTKIKLDVVNLKVETVQK
jgi:hypothetical protein